MSQVAILVPAMRPQNLERLVASIAESTSDYKVVIIATGECAEKARSLSGPITVIDDGGGTYPVRVNRAFNETNERYVVLAADDVVFYPGWFEAAMIHMGSANGVVGLNDQMNQAGVHFVVDREYINELGGYVGAPGVVMHPEFIHTYCDDMLRNTAIAHGRWAYAGDAVIEHMHPGAGKAPTDEVYQMGLDSMGHDLALFQSLSHTWQDI